jgi:hypothetical protein
MATTPRPTQPQTERSPVGVLQHLRGRRPKGHLMTSQTAANSITTAAAPRFGLTGKGRLYVALQRLAKAEPPDELAGRLADVVNTIAREHPAPSRRCPLVGAITA